VDKEIIDLLTEIKNKITDDSDVVWTRFNTVDELRKHLDNYILRLNQGDKKVINDINIDFAPTSTFQELSIQNGWSEDYIRLASKFDRLYERHR
jgi:hypothetical protein